VEGAEQPPHDAHVYAVRDEAAYLQAVEEKQPAPPEPLDPASILCQFCGKSWEQAPMLFQAKRRTMDPNTSAIVAVWICDECVAQLGQILAAEPPGTRGSVGGRLGPIPSDRSSADPALIEHMQEPTASLVLAGMPSGCATHVPHQANTCGIERTTTVNSKTLMSGPSLALAA